MKLTALDVLLCIGLGAVSGLSGCRAHDERTLITISGSEVGAEAESLRTLLGRYMNEHPGIRVELRTTPDAADQRHQLYVQWLNARATDPDVVQLDTIWLAEFAAAGWILPLDRFAPGVEDFLESPLAASRWRDALHAVPWFIDVGMLYRRTDLISAPPSDLEELSAQAAAARERAGIPFGYVWQGARYEGLICVFVEILGALGGEILDSTGRVVVDSEAAVRALEFLRGSIASNGFVPEAVLTWSEEQTRFAFQNGDAAFMRNWPYAWRAMADPATSPVAGHYDVGAIPGSSSGHPTAALGGALLAINSSSDQPEAAWSLIEYLTSAGAMLERAKATGQLPARSSLYQDDALGKALGIPLERVRSIVTRAIARPVTPVYTELSEILQIHLHRALTGQEEPREALRWAAREIRALLERSGLPEARS